jgi:hypothetical protein
MPGYRDPPKHSRYKPGQSGNPNGGPRGPRRKAALRRSTFLNKVIKCTIGGRPFEGMRRQAIPLFAALWSLTKPIPGSTAPGASEKAKSPKPNLALQQLLMKLADQEEAIDRRIRRDEPVFAFIALPSAPDRVSCIEDAADVAGFGRRAYHKQKSARVLLESWVIEEGLARLGDRRLSRDEQTQVLGGARFPKKMKWPDWWEPDLRERRKGWRAPQVAKNITPPPPPETIRMSVKEYLIAREPYRLKEEEFEYARRYAAADPEDREILRKPFERPGYKGM